MQVLNEAEKWELNGLMLLEFFAHTGHQFLSPFGWLNITLALVDRALDLLGAHGREFFLKLFLNVIDLLRLPGDRASIFKWVIAHRFFSTKRRNMPARKDYALRWATASLGKYKSAAFAFRTPKCLAAFACFRDTFFRYFLRGLCVLCVKRLRGDSVKIRVAYSKRFLATKTLQLGLECCSQT
jgi:hypothetical protein